VDRLKADADVGALIGEASEQKIQVGADAFRRTDPQLALLASNECGGGKGEVVAGAQCLSGARKQLAAGTGQRHVVARALKQNYTELGLEASNELADGRLDNPQALRGTAKVKLISDGHEGGELAQLHQATIARRDRSQCARAIAGTRSGL
jgi:hypothetical protein